MEGAFVWLACVGAGEGGESCWEKTVTYLLGNGLHGQRPRCVASTHRRGYREKKRGNRDRVSAKGQNVEETMRL